MKLFILYGENDNFSIKTISKFFKKQSAKIIFKADIILKFQFKNRFSAEIVVKTDIFIIPNR